MARTDRPHSLSGIRARATQVALVGLCAVALAGCGDDGSTLETGGPPDTGGVTTTEAGTPPTTDGPDPAGATAATCRVGDGPTGPIFDPGLQAEFGDIQPGQPDFDWNGDGQADSLSFEVSTDSVIVDHGAGAFEATGVPSDFGDLLYEAPGPVEEAGPDGPPSPEAFVEGRAGPTPAAVGDFTGDGRPDLAVFSRGELVVHATSVQDSTGPVTRDFAAPQAGATSWASPRGTTDLPFDEATVVAVGDIDGDGVGDLRVDSYAPRAFVSAAFYLGKPCEP